MQTVMSEQFDRNFIDSFESAHITVIQIQAENFFDITGLFWDSLSDEEIIVARHMQAGILRNKYIIHRGVLRWLISKILNTSPKQIQLIIDHYGKPGLKTHACADLSFNLSHSSNWALYAFTRGSHVGIDVEEEQENLCLDELAPLFLSARELKIFKSLNGHVKPHAFYKYWTLKEAISKCYGRGMSMDYTRIDVGLSFPDDLGMLQKYKNMLIFDISKKSQYFASLAIKNPL